MADYDAIVVGGGHNGLAAAIILAGAGCRVLVLERNGQAGGAIQTAEVTLPGFRHDLFATNLNLFAGSPFFRKFGSQLQARGLQFTPACKPFGSIFPDGTFVGVSTRLEETQSMLSRFSPRDGEAWGRLLREFQSRAPHLFPLLGQRVPSLGLLRTLWKGTRRLGREWPLELLRLFLQSPGDFVREHFESPQVQALVASWGMHLDFPPSMAGGALFPYLESMTSQMNGLVLGRGGAAVMVEAMVSLLRDLGGEVRCSSPVRRILVRSGRAVAVQLQEGGEISAARAIIANLTPTLLFLRLVDSSLSEAFLNKVRRYRYGPGTMMIHLALSAPVPWRAEGRPHEYAYVHVGPYLEDMDRCYYQAVANLLPDNPTLVVGQPTAVDPTRAPEGKHILWIQVRALPARIRGDAAGEIAAADWDTAKEAYADRVLQRLELYAPGLQDLILARQILSPLDLERANPNLVGGDSLGGSHHLMQNFFLRPIPGWSTYQTPIENLYMCGAATWPGAGVGAGSGTLLGEFLLRTRF